MDDELEESDGEEADVDEDEENEVEVPPNPLGAADTQAETEAWTKRQTDKNMRNNK